MLENNTDIALVRNFDPVMVFTPEGMSGLLQDIETQVKSHVPIIDTEEGRKDIISLAYKVSQSKSLIVKTGDREVESAKKKVKAMGVLLKTAKEFLDDLRDETRRPVTEWEAEEKRKADEEARKEAEKMDKRVADLLAIEVTIPRIDVAVMGDDEFDCLLSDKTFEFEERQKEKAIAKAAEEKRLADEKAEREAEAKRLADQKAKQDAEAKAIQEQKDELVAQQKAIDDEKIRANERRWRDRLSFLYDAGWNGQEAFDRETEETIFSHEELVNLSDTDFYKKADAYNVMVENRNKQAADNARIKAEADAKAKAEREAKEAEERELAAREAEERRIALLPDKEKIQTWLMNIEIQWLDKYPADVSEEAAQFIATVRDELASQILEYRQELEKF